MSSALERTNLNVAAKGNASIFATADALKYVIPQGLVPHLPYHARKKLHMASIVLPNYLAILGSLEKQF